MAYLGEGEDIRRVPSAISFITFDVNRDISDGSKTWHCELSSLCFIEINQAIFTFAELEPEIWGQIEAFP